MGAEHRFPVDAEVIAEVWRRSGANPFENIDCNPMSALAAELLQRKGFYSGSVRGPAHWATAANERVSDLWQRSQAEQA